MASLPEGTKTAVDADTVFRAVRETLPGTSLQAVYGVLGALTGVGLVRRFDPAGSPALFERRVGDNHHHLVCSNCGTIRDVDCVIGAAPCLTPVDTAGFRIHTAEVTFWGLCAECAADPENSSDPIDSTTHTHSEETP